MAFTPITITGTFERPDTTPAQGSVTLTLTEPVHNGTETIEPTPIMGVLNATGQLVNESLEALIVAANDDTGTLPVGSSYLIVIELDNAPVREFHAVIPHTAPGGTIDLSSLEP